nr:hypothetical protein pmam_239 [Pithovirus mammoth]
MIFVSEFIFSSLICYKILLANKRAKFKLVSEKLTNFQPKSRQQSQTTHKNFEKSWLMTEIIHLY